MRIDWATLITIFLAIVLAELFCRGVFGGGSSTSVGTKTHSPAEPVVTYANPIDEFIAKNYPNARR